MRKVYTLKVNDYFPELCAITIPWLRAYATRIGAEFVEVTERKFPEFPPTYEKLQLYDLTPENEWSILIDADIIVNPQFPNVLKIVPIDHIGLYMTYPANMLFEADQYFARDGRALGIASNFLVVHNCNHDIWTPLEIPYEEAVTKSKRLHILDEYCISRNVARFGLKVAGVYEGTSMPAPRKILDDPLVDDLIHLDVSTNSKTDVLDVARKVDAMWRAKYGDPERLFT